MYLDLGQRDFNARLKCHCCGMVYSPHDREDVRSHEKFCHEMSSGPKVSVQRTHLQVVWTNEEDSSYIVVFKSNELNTHSIKWKAFRQVIDSMFAELSSSEMDLHDENIHSIFFFIHNSRIQGCVMVERVHSSLVFIINQHSLDSHSTVPLNYSSSPQGYKLGVRYIWVNRSARRSKVASRLVDAARAKFLLTSVGKEEVVFSQPTSEGMRFASAYLAKDSIPVYK